MISAVVSGSFKFKPEIDRTIETLEETGITVLEPAKGWLLMPTFEVIERLRHGQVRPLPTEEGLTTREIEGRFLKALNSANLLYLMNQEGYIGSSAALEVGFALGKGKPIYTLEPPVFITNNLDELTLNTTLAEVAITLPPEDVATHYRQTFNEL